MITDNEMLIKHEKYMAYFLIFNMITTKLLPNGNKLVEKLFLENVNQYLVRNILITCFLFIN